MKSRTRQKPRSYEYVTLKLRKRDKEKLRLLLRAGTQNVRVVKRSRVLELLDAGKSAPEAAEGAGVAPATARRIGKRYLEAGLDHAIFDSPRPGAAPLLDHREETQIVAMVCSKPPDGYSRWSIRLIAREAVERGIVDEVGRETIRLLLLNHGLKPWREKNVVRA